MQMDSCILKAISVRARGSKIANTHVTYASTRMENDTEFKSNSSLNPSLNPIAVWQAQTGENIYVYITNRRKTTVITEDNVNNCHRTNNAVRVQMVRVLSLPIIKKEKNKRLLQKLQCIKLA